MGTLLADVRYSLRTLIRSPAFALIAVLTLALGVGANTAIFSVVRSVLLRPLPFPEPDRIVDVFETRLDRGWARSSFTLANFWDVRDMNTSFMAVAAIAGGPMNLTGFEQPERLRGFNVSAEFFKVLSVRPVAGRVFATGEDEPGADTRVVVLSDQFWSARFGADPSLIGRTLMLDGESYSVIGVVPVAGSWLSDANVFVPLVHTPDANRGSFELEVIGRLKAGVTLDAAQADLDGIARRLAELYPEPDRGMGIGMSPSSEWIASDSVRRALWVLMGAVSLLLLIACVNLVNLMLARATGRVRERALRAALGASRGRIARLVLTESMIVALLGASLGLGLAFGMVQLLHTFDPRDIPRLADVSIDGWVLAFTVGAALITGLITGLIPALRAPYRDVIAALRENERSVAGNRRQGRLRGVLVGVEIALSLVLLVGAGLLLRSFEQVLETDRGFETEDRAFFEVPLPSSYEDGERVTLFITQMLARIESMPQVTSAAAINVRPMRGVNVGMGFAASDRPPPIGDAVPWASWRLITRDYFQTMGVPLIAGRDFTEQDLIAEPWRVIISQRMAEMLWPGENALGRNINLWQGQGNSVGEVIGVVANMRDWGLEDGPSLAVYLPHYGAGSTTIQFVLHSGAPSASLVPAFRSALAELDPDVPLANVQSLDEIVGASVASRRFTMLMLASFAGLALLLALAGVYGVLSYTVSRRTSEIGMRLALGASPGGVLRLIVGQGMRPVLFGLVIGIGGALALSRVMSSLLFEVTAADLPTYAGGAALLMASALLACYLPARNAMRVNVMTALREE
jgi:putative ABC transport system permease protein